MTGTMRAAIVCLPIAAGLCAGPDPRGADPRSAGVDEWLAIADRLLDEAERQHAVEGRMGAVIEKFRSILRDLASNDLVERGKAGETQGHVAALDRLNAQNIPRAADLLEMARRVRATAPASIDGAAREIETIVEELARVLAEAGAGYRREELLAELGMLIEEEERAHADTQAWGAKLYESSDAAEKDRPGLVRTQDRLAERTGRFVERLGAARDAESDPAVRVSMESAHKVLAEKGAQGLLSGAARDIEAKKPIGAVRKQRDALAALREAERILRGQDEAKVIRETIEKLKEILKRQRGLREGIEKAGEEAFRRESPDLQIEQRGLRNAAGEIDPALFEPAAGEPPPEGGNPMPRAERAMADAEGGIQAAEMPRATAAQKEAEKALEDGIAILEKKLGEERKLQDLLSQAGLAAERLEALREFEERQRDLLEKTETLSGAKEPVNPLSPAQEKLREDVDRFASTLAPSPWSTPMKQPLAHATDAMADAARALGANQPQAAIPAETRALDALRQAQRWAEQELAAIEGQLPFAMQAMGLDQLLDQLKALLAQQVKLRRETQASAAEAKDVKPIAPPQANLRDATGQIAQNIPPPLPIRVSLDQAGQAMTDAAGALEQSQPATAIPAQRRGEGHLQDAIRGVEDLVAQLDALWQQFNQAMQRAAALAAQQQQLMQSTMQAGSPMLPSIAAPQGALSQQTMSASGMPFGGMIPFSQASMFMQQAMGALSQSAQQPALGAQQQALNSLLPGMQGMRGMMGQLGQMGQMGQGMMSMMALGQMGMQGMMGMMGMMGMGLGMFGMTGIPWMPGIAMPGSITMNPVDGMRMFPNATPMGAPAGRGDASWNPLGPRERDALLQRYARELPIEYRPLLEEYYEALAK